MKIPVLATVAVSSLFQGVSIAGSEPGLTATLAEYAQAARESGEAGMTIEETVTWVAQIESQIPNAEDPETAQVAYGAIIGLWNWHEEWQLSLDACDVALAAATTEQSQLVRLIDRYSIAAAMQPGGAGRMAGEAPKPTTFDRIRKIVDGMSKDHKLGMGMVASISSIYSRESVIAQVAGDLRSSNKILREMVGFMESPAASHVQAIGAIRVRRDARVRLAAHELIRADVRTALRVCENPGVGFALTSQEIIRVLELADSYEPDLDPGLRWEFIRSATFSDVSPYHELLLYYLFAHELARTLGGDADPAEQRRFAAGVNLFEVVALLDQSIDAAGRDAALLGPVRDAQAQGARGSLVESARRVSSALKGFVDGVPD